MTGALLAEVFFLGIAAFDPVGLAAMPILLSQPRGVTRSWVFVLGSMAALLGLGVAFASGLGKPILHFSQRYPWIDPVIEVVLAVVLLALGVWLLLRVRRARATGQDSSLASAGIVKRLELPLPLLFIFGFVLVTVQSIVDVAFLLAMVEMGTKLSGLLEISLSVMVYTFAALLLQILVVVGYQLLPVERRAASLRAFNKALERYGEVIAAVVMLVLGVILAVMSVHDLIYLP